MAWLSLSCPGWQSQKWHGYLAFAGHGPLLHQRVDKELGEHVEAFAEVCGTCGEGRGRVGRGDAGGARAAGVSSLVRRRQEDAVGQRLP